LDGKRTLLVDIDPQGNTTNGVGIDKTSLSVSLYHVLDGSRLIGEIVCETAVPELSLIPATKDLVGAEIELVSGDRREYRLKDALAGVAAHYEYVLLDCPPSLGLLTLNALTAADSLLIPIQSEYYALEGLSSILETMRLVQQSFNSGLRLEGIVITMFDSRNRLSHQVVEEIREHFPDKLFHTIVRRNVRLSESPSYGKPICMYDAGSTGAQDYRDLAKELISRGEHNVDAEKRFG
jgi:chromosome partitioning protein